MWKFSCIVRCLLDILFSRLHTEQESIHVGSIPPTCQPYLFGGRHWVSLLVWGGSIPGRRYAHPSLGYLGKYLGGVRYSGARFPTGGGKYPRRDMGPEIPTPAVNRHTPVKYNITLPQPLLRVLINVPAFAVT